MDNKLFEKIKEYNTIIIHRHSRPDGDALGSQIGLAKTLKYNYPNKNIYVVGDSSAKYGFFGEMDEIDDSVYEGALAIIVDVAVEAMASDLRYKLAKEVYVIDHHKNDCDITSNHIVDTSRVAAAEFIAYLLDKHGLTIPADAATALYGGITTDSGRFLYGNSLGNTFDVASLLVKCGANPKYIYDNIYTETLEDRQMKSYFSNRFEIKDGVAFLKNGPEVFEKFPREFNDISRGMLSVMSGIDEIKIWLNFTYDPSTGKIVGEYRSRSVEIVGIAKKYTGGGHALACGSPVESWAQADEIIDDFVKLLKESE